MNKEDFFPQFEKLLLPWLGRAMKSFDFHLADELANAGIALSKHQIILLRILSLQDGIPQNNLAFITDRDKTSLTRLISTMERKGLLKRKTCELDKRVNNVFITQKGLKETKNAFPVIINEIDNIQHKLDTEEIETTIKVLKQIITYTNRKELPLTILK
ncbi:MAG: MarR family transcriptional regulator [Flammeovirgaceae bacterium]|nr:MarR family transcriptional regulator [Flammeovirgaceae bacterium]|tara:strand:- start:180 stop:656 length:477 start_codon:yes stop_codon:yes gene_type:complete